MADSENYHQLIENYLDGLLAPQLREDFENRLIEDEELREELKTEIAARNFLEMAQDQLLLDKFDAWDDQIDLEGGFYKKKVVEEVGLTTRRKLWLPLSIAAAISIFLIFWLTLPTDNLSGEQKIALAGAEVIFQQEKTSYQGQETSQDKLKVNQDAEDYFKAGNIPELEKIVFANPDLPYPQWHLGFAYIKAGKIAKAKDFLFSNDRAFKLSRKPAREFFQLLFQVLEKEDPSAMCEALKAQIDTRGPYVDAAKAMAKEAGCDIDA
ncbi:MAG: hypothetical protein AAF696_13605 [Bacteroidota bacterium]